MELVKIKIPALNGQRVISGKIVRELSGDRVEIRSQNDGYWTVHKSEIVEGK
jgi:hypothetical protein